MDDVVVLAALILATVFGLFGFLAFWRDREDEDFFRGFGAKMAGEKSDKTVTSASQRILQVLVKDFKDGLQSYGYLRQKHPGIKDGHVRYVVDPNWQPPPTTGYAVILHTNPDFSVLRIPEGQMPEVTGSIQSKSQKLKRDWWLRSRKIEMAASTVLVIVFLLLARFGLHGIMFYENNPPILYGLWIVPLAALLLGLVIGGVWGFQTLMDAIDAVADHLRLRGAPKKKPNHEKLAQIVKLIDEGQSQRQIAKKLKIKQQNVSYHVKMLHSKQLIERIEGGPVPKYRATERGKQAVKKVFGGD